MYRLLNSALLRSRRDKIEACQRPRESPHHRTTLTRATCPARQSARSSRRGSHRWQASGSTSRS